MTFCIPLCVIQLAQLASRCSHRHVTSYVTELSEEFRRSTAYSALLQVVQHKLWASIGRTFNTKSKYSPARHC